jgi:membrane-associated HD superfamily phosphohydrolase
MAFFFSQRSKLARKGLGGGKQRRRAQTPGWLQFIHTSRFVSFCIGATTLAMLVVIIVFSRGGEEYFLTEGQRSPRTITCSTSFAYPDEEATRLARKAVSDATPPVYQIKLQEITKDVNLFGSHLEELKKLNLNNLSWSQVVPSPGNDTARRDPPQE